MGWNSGVDYQQENGWYRPKPASIAFSVVPSITGGVTDLTGSTSYSKSLDVGTYSVGRVIAVGVMARTNNSSGPSSVTIGGVTATQISAHANSGAVADTSIWYVDASSAGGPVTTSGTVTVVVNFALAPSRIGLFSYSIYGASASAPTGVSSVANSPMTENTLSVPSGGSIMVFQFSTLGYPSTQSATSFTQDVNANIVGAQGYCALHSTPGALSGTPSVTISATSSITSSAWSLASWGP